jgi:hypothetical protein
MVEKKYTIVRRECDITLTLSEDAFRRVMDALEDDRNIIGCSEEYELFLKILLELNGG